MDSFAGSKLQSLLPIRQEGRRQRRHRKVEAWSDVRLGIKKNADTATHGSASLAPSAQLIQTAATVHEQPTNRFSLQAINYTKWRFCCTNSTLPHPFCVALSSSVSSSRQLQSMQIPATSLLRHLQSTPSSASSSPMQIPAAATFQQHSFLHQDQPQPLCLIFFSHGLLHPKVPCKLLMNICLRG
ncbi:hypothetical protein M5K25_003535 [Dendrobium thyrsiflorum]|uniref:Uncharacterized protein n=1 Tax=Dendrobium thyrsiflorum TaxID=117978 RepID=A0ABD0VJ66_DENTH